MTEAQLIVRYLQGDEEAAASLIERHALSTFRLALSILDDPDEAEEAAQEAWINALNHLDSFRGEASFRTWLYRVTLNACMERLRKRSQGRRLQETLAAVVDLFRRAQNQPEEAVLVKERESQVFEAVQSLAQAERITITLRYYQDLTIAQIAEVMGVSERTVYSRLRDANEHLRNILVSKEGSP